MSADRQRLERGMREALLSQGTYAPGEKTMRRRLDALLPVVEAYATQVAAEALRAVHAEIETQRRLGHVNQYGGDRIRAAVKTATHHAHG